MKTLGISLVTVGAVLALSPAASAQSSDAGYCKVLIDTYLRYVAVGGEAPVGAGKSPNAIHTTAVAQCRAGDTASGIPVLEKVLTDAKFTLPRRG